MDDALLVSRARSGDLDAFGQLYDQYFPRIYDFSWRILRNSEEAADVTQDVFMKAMQNLPGLSKASSFKSWLFTIAHNTAVTRAERAGRTVPLPEPVHEEAFGAFDVPDPSRLADPALASADAELASLVWEAATALNPRDYALLDLHVRQGLDSAEIAGVMNVSKGNAYTMVSRMKDAAEDVISSYVVARRGSKDCEGLQQTLAAFDFPPYTEEIRKPVDAHIKDCATCQGARKRLTGPLEIFGGFAMVPAPLALKGDIWGNVSGAWTTSGPGSPGHSSQPTADSLPAGPYSGAGGDGSGVGGGLFAMGGGDGDGWDRTKVMWFIGGVLGLLLFAFAGGALIAGALGGGDEGSGGGAATDTPTAAITVLASRTPGVVIHTPTPNLTPSTTPGPTDTPLPTDTPAPVATNTPSVSATPTVAAAATPTTSFFPTGTSRTQTPTPEPSVTPAPTKCPSETLPNCAPTPPPKP
jgi:RNA polymerase sigma factor (sigma-70 family)